MIERRRIWTDALLADYIRDELGFPGARQGAMVEQESVDIATGEVSRERWYLLTSLGSRQWGPRELLRLFRNHWSVENSLHHVKDRSWDEDVHTLRRPGLGEIFATLVNTGLNALRLEGWFQPGYPCPCEPRLAPSAQRRPSPASTVELTDFAIVLLWVEGRRSGLVRNRSLVTEPEAFQVGFDSRVQLGGLGLLLAPLWTVRRVIFSSKGSPSSSWGAAPT